MNQNFQHSILVICQKKVTLFASLFFWDINEIKGLDEAPNNERVVNQTIIMI